MGKTVVEYKERDGKLYKVTRHIRLRSRSTVVPRFCAAGLRGDGGPTLAMEDLDDAALFHQLKEDLAKREEEQFYREGVLLHERLTAESPSFRQYSWPFDIDSPAYVL